MNSMAATIFLSFSLVGTLLAQTAPNLSGVAPIPPAIVPAAPKAPALVWSSESQDYDAKPGEVSAPFAFTFTNVSPAEVVINSALTSCGCTVAQLPKQPWPIAPGATGEIKVTMNLVGKQGRVTKQVTVTSTDGSKALLVNVNIAPPAPVTAAENLRGDRNANMEKAKADRQVVFQGDCRSCHVDKGVGKMGKELFAADCGICHDTPHRAPMVADLRAPKAPRDQAYWINWITYGRPGSLMPAFGEKDGGPLKKEQIDSLVTYLMENFPQNPTGAATPVVAPVPALAPPVPSKSGAGQ